MSFITNVFYNIFDFNIKIILGTGIVLGSYFIVYSLEELFFNIYKKPFIPTKKNKLT